MSPSPQPPRRQGAPETGAGRRPLRRVDETSAGGLVLDRLGPGASGALIGRLDRRGRLLGPAEGHLEAGETEPQTAVREVAEERASRTGHRQARGPSTSGFVADGRRVHKTVHHFLLLASTR
jgi:8-oxo-dGTP pyrophosphatase MutT (NUDIX family)